MAERRAHFEPRWRRALAEFSDDELLTAAAVLDRLRDTFYDVADDREPPAGARLEAAPAASAPTVPVSEPPR